MFMINGISPMWFLVITAEEISITASENKKTVKSLASLKELVYRPVNIRANV